MALDDLRELLVQLRHASVELAAGAQRLDHEEPCQGPVRGEGVEHRQQSGIGLLDRVHPRSYGLFDLAPQPLGGALQQFQEDGLLAGEVKVDAALGRL